MASATNGLRARTNLRVQAPPVNLKERIAAFQQRNASPGPRPTSPSPAPTPSPNSAGLRDKIAKFEKKGGIPVPRGSFGLGAPPLAENGQAKRRGELYGNRIPGAVRASGGGPTTSRSASPFESSRSFSLSALDVDEMDSSPTDTPPLTDTLPSSPSSPSSPASPFLGLTMDHTGSRETAPRGTPFATALDIARRAEINGEVLEKQASRDAAPPPSMFSQPVLNDNMDGLDTNAEQSPVQDSPPAIIISSSDTPPSPQALLPPETDISVTEADPYHSSDSFSPSPSSSVSPPQSTLVDEVIIREVEDVEQNEEVTQTSPEHTEMAVAETSELVPTVFSSDSDLSSPSPGDLSQEPLVSGDADEPVSGEALVAPSVTPDTPSVVKVEECDQSTPTPAEGKLDQSSVDPQIISSSSVVADVTPAAGPSPVPGEGGMGHGTIEDDDVPKDFQYNPEAGTAVQTSEVQSPEVQSPVGPLTLADAVFKLGQVVANIQDLFPDQISPLATPPAYISLHLDAPTDDGTRSHRRQDSISRERTKKPSVDLTIQLETTPNKAASPPLPEVESEPSITDDKREPERQEDEQNANPVIQKPVQLSESPIAEENTNEMPLATPVSADQFGFLTTPHTPSGRPMSMIETSPSHVAQAHRITPLTSRGIPVYLSASQQQGPQDFSHFPPTPDHQEMDFGTVSLHKSSHSFSHARTYAPHSQENKGPSFSAVVHSKVTELPSSSSAPVMPQTPQMNRAKRTLHGEVPPSPGYGELAALLQEAALLEKTLEQGELPSEAIRQEALEKQRLKEQEKTDALLKAADLGQRGITASKDHTKREESESKSKSSFRNTILRSKSTHRKDLSLSASGGQALSSGDVARAKSVLLPYRSPVVRQTASSQQSIQPHALETHDEVPSLDADNNSPKSPRQYFAGLRRLASTSRTSITSSIHPRHSASTSSEMSSEDSTVATPPDGGMDSAGSAPSGGPVTEFGHAGYWNGSGITWPSLSPKKGSGGSSSISRATSFAEKMWPRGRTKSSVSTSSAYETIGSCFTSPSSILQETDKLSTDRITKSAAAKAAAAAIPPLDPVSFSLEVPVVQDVVPPSPLDDLVSPRRSSSLNVTSTSQFPPVYSPMPTSPVYTPHMHSSAMRLEEVSQPLHVDALLPGPAENTRPSSWASADSTTSSIPSPLFDSFPAVPHAAAPPPSAGFTHHVLPLSLPSFFDANPLSSTPVGSEFITNPSPFLRSATITRPVTMPPQGSTEYQRR